MPPGVSLTPVALRKSPGDARSGAQSPRTRARAMLLKSASVRMLESEGGLMQPEFFNGQTGNDLVSLSCLTAVKNLQETGRFGEAQNELENVVQKSKASREHGMACLLLAELFNKWGAASGSYTIDIMERGIHMPCPYTSFSSKSFSHTASSQLSSLVSHLGKTQRTHAQA